MKMKKFFIVTVAGLSLLTVGCGKKEKENKRTETKTEKTPQEIAMEKYSKDYYERFMNKYLTDPEVSLEKLRKANKDGYTEYDLKDLEKCKDTSTTKLVLKEGTNEVTGYKHSLDCSK